MRFKVNHFNCTDLVEMLQKANKWENYCAIILWRNEKAFEMDPYYIDDDDVCKYILTGKCTIWFKSIKVMNFKIKHLNVNLNVSTLKGLSSKN